MTRQRKVHALSGLRAADGSKRASCGETAEPILTSIHDLVTCRRCQAVLGQDAL